MESVLVVQVKRRATRIMSAMEELLCKGRLMRPGLYSLDKRCLRGSMIQVYRLRRSIGSYY